MAGLLDKGRPPPSTPDLIASAVTPPAPRRFNARFFCAREDATGTPPFQQLGDIRWVKLDEARELRAN